MSKNAKKRLLIIGAGGFGRELAGYLEDEFKNSSDIWLAGFIDDNPNALSGKNCKYSILGAIETFDFQTDDLAILAIGNIEIKISVYLRLKKDVNFFSFVSSKASIGPFVDLGEGSIVCPGSKLGANMKLGDFVSINVDSVIGHDVVIGDFCSIMPNVDIGGGAIIGREVYASTKTVVAPLLKVCSKAYLGLGSVNIKNVTEPGTYFGNPARKML